MRSVPTLTDTDEFLRNQWGWECRDHRSQSSSTGIMGILQLNKLILKHFVIFNGLVCTFYSSSTILDSLSEREAELEREPAKVGRVMLIKFSFKSPVSIDSI
jgi:hypothetical protein